jgi:glycosyltransferase involved in cell wall biosynthesis
LTVAGYGSEDARLRRMGECLGARFVGRVEPPQMPALLDGADIFLNASVVDNQPVSILEAFAAGLTVVSTPTGDIASMVRHGSTGLLVPPDAPDAMAEAVCMLLADSHAACEMTARARREVRRHTWSEIRSAWADVYRAA